MSNESLANTFQLIADLLEIKGENVYKVLAYRRAAESILQQSQDVSSLDIPSLIMIPGIGQAIAEKIQEIHLTGKLEFLEKLETEIPSSIIELLKLQDIGPKRTALLWKKANITNIQELEKAASEGNLRQLPGMGTRIEQRILENIQLLKQAPIYINISSALENAEDWLHYLGKTKYFSRLEIAGSIRRGKPNIHDIDLVAASSQPSELMAVFLKSPKMDRVLSEGRYMSSIVQRNGLQVQLWIHPAERFGTLYQFVTGSKEHNVHLREVAQKQGFSLSERGLIVDSDMQEIFCAQEEHLYQHLNMPWTPPELREDRGEIQAALENTLPQLIRREDIIADLHMHSNWSDGRNSLEELATRAIKDGLKVLAFTDHSPKWEKIGALNEERIKQRKTELERIQQKVGDQILLLQGVEVDILPDGSLDFPDEVLCGMDVVVASLHEDLDQSKEQITARLIAAIHNPHVDIIGHPNGKEEGKHPGADANWDKVFRAASLNNTSLEINSHPCHLELDEYRAQQAAKIGVPISINTDTHQLDEFSNLRFGVGIARRAWLQKENIINSWPVPKILAWLKRD